METTSDTVIVVACETAAGGRSENQDRCLARRLDPAQNLWGFRALLVVADGMGGHEQGEVAAQLAAETALEVLGARPEDHGDFESGFLGGGCEDVLRRTFSMANQRIHEWAEREGVVGNMGTTLTVAAFTEAEVTIGNVGDSRAFVVVSEGITQLSEDHSFVAQQVRDGVLTEDEASRSPLRGHLTQAVGAESSVDPYVVTAPIEPDATFVLCSDGLTEVIQPTAIQGVVHVDTVPEQVCETLIAMAVQAGTTDNVTVAVGYARPGTLTERVASPAPTQEEPEPAVPAEPGEPAVELVGNPTPRIGPSVQPSEPPDRSRYRDDLSAERNRRLAMLGAVSLVSLIIGLLIGRAFVPKRDADGESETTHISDPTTVQPGDAASTDGAPAGAIVPMTDGGFRLEIACERNMIIVRGSEPVEYSCYPRSDSSSLLEPGQLETGDGAAFTLPADPPSDWQGETIVLDVERLGGGRLKAVPQPADISVFVNRNPYSGDALDSLPASEGTARIGVYFPPGAGEDAYGVVIPELPVELQ